MLNNNCKLLAISRIEGKKRFMLKNKTKKSTKTPITNNNKRFILGVYKLFFFSPISEIVFTLSAFLPVDKIDTTHRPYTQILFPALIHSLTPLHSTTAGISSPIQSMRQYIYSINKMLSDFVVCSSMFCYCCYCCQLFWFMSMA